MGFPKNNLNELKGIIAGLMEPPGDPARFGEATAIRGDLGFDSVGMVDLMIEVEGRFGVYFDPLEQDLTKVFQTVGSLLLFVEERSNPKGGR